MSKVEFKNLDDLNLYSGKIVEKGEKTFKDCIIMVPKSGFVSTFLQRLNEGMYGYFEESKTETRIYKELVADSVLRKDPNLEVKLRKNFNIIAVRDGDKIKVKNIYVTVRDVMLDDIRSKKESEKAIEIDESMA